MIKIKNQKKVVCLAMATMMTVCFMPSITFNSYAARPQVKKITRLQPTKSKDIVIPGVGEDYRTIFRIKSSPKQGVPKSEFKTKYTSSNKKVAKISRRGSLLPVAPGSTRITCRNLRSGAKTYWDVKIIAKPIELKKYSPKSRYVLQTYIRNNREASRMQYSVMRESNHKLGTDIVFKSSNPEILKISKRGSAVAEAPTEENSFVKVTAYNKLTGGLAVWQVAVADKYAADIAKKAADEFKKIVDAMPSIALLKEEHQPAVDIMKRSFNNLSKAAVALIDSKTMTKYEDILKTMDRFMEQKLIRNVLQASNQLELKDAFKKLGIVNANPSSYPQYMNKISSLPEVEKNKLNKAGIQKIIDDINTGNLQSNEQAKLATEIRDAVEEDNQVVLYDLLNSSAIKKFHVTNTTVNSEKVDAAFNNQYFNTNMITIGTVGSFSILDGSLVLPSKAMQDKLSVVDFDNIQNWIYKNNAMVIDEFVRLANGDSLKLEEAKAVALANEADKNKEFGFLIADSEKSRVTSKVGELPSESIQKGIDSILAEIKIEEVKQTASELMVADDWTAQNFITALQKIGGIKNIPTKDIVKTGSNKYRSAITGSINTIDELNKKLDEGTISIIADPMLTTKDNIISHLNVLGISNLDSNNAAVYAADNFLDAYTAKEVQNRVNLINNNVKIKPAFAKLRVAASRDDVQSALDAINRYYVIKVGTGSNTYIGNEAYAVDKVMEDLAGNGTIINSAVKAYTTPNIANVNELVKVINKVTGK